LKRLEQIVRDQFIARIAHGEDAVLMKFDRGENHDRGGDNGCLKSFRE
jgi:hypothetical protein